MKLGSKKMHLPLILFILSCVWLSWQPITDPDFGWHLRTGEFVVKNFAVPKTDIFSYSLPEHNYVAYSWLLDTIIYLIYQTLGLWGINGLYTAIVAMIGFLWHKNIRQNTNSNFIYYSPLAMMPLALDFLGLRTQLVSLLGLSLVDYWLGFYDKNPKTKSWWLIIMWYWVWTNLHGGFLVGWAYWAIWIGGDLIEHLISQPYKIAIKSWWQKDWKLMGMMPLIMTVSLINPYGPRLITFLLGMVNTSTQLLLNTDWLPLLSSLFSKDSLLIRWLVALLPTVTLIVTKKPMAETSIGFNVYYYDD